MNKLLVLLVVVGMALSANAQCPVQVTVQRITKKKSAQGEVTTQGNMQYFQYNTANSSLTLRITLQNTSIRPVEDVVVRWGVAKTRLTGTGHAGDVAYGKEEKCSLKPKEVKVIETETVQAKKQESQISERQFGEKIHGHGVQVMIGGRPVWEEFVPGTIKKSFENLRPIEDQEKDQGQDNQPKKKKK